MEGGYEAAACTIVICGSLDEHWTDYFGGLTLRTERNAPSEVTTVLSGQVTDFAAFAGLLARVQNLGLPVQALTFECLPAVLSGKSYDHD
ncbi:MAG: hypothetical protein IPK16_06955 [Anaerolineales bacterium]|nr:hypothetical protein [Anaerolineales bacterium]